ncbi:hypothetical protein L7F22_025584 [Adiantum nelumboides]|nr:hypothetical protein [Adiantum nelumboides]
MILIHRVSDELHIKQLPGKGSLLFMRIISPSIEELEDPIPGLVSFNHLKEEEKMNRKDIPSLRSETHFQRSISKAPASATPTSLNNATSTATGSSLRRTSKAPLRRRLPWRGNEREAIRRGILMFGLGRSEKVRGVMRSSVKHLQHGLGDIADCCCEFVRACSAYADLRDRAFVENLLYKTNGLGIEVGSEVSERVGQWEKMEKSGAVWLKRIRLLDSLAHVIKLCTNPRTQEIVYNAINSLGDATVPCDWWTREADLALLAGVYSHGFGNYEALRMDDEFVEALKPPWESREMGLETNCHEQNTSKTFFEDNSEAEPLARLSFLQQFDKAYAGGNFTEASKVRKAATYLTGNVGQWWTTLLLQGQARSTWIYFKQIFASAWLSDEFEADVMTEWHQLNAATCKNLDNFNRKFWKALLPVTSYRFVTLTEQIEKYCCGLRKGLRKYCTKTKVTTLTQLIEVANTDNGLLKGEDCEFNTGVKEGSAKKNSAKKYVLNEVLRATQEPAKAWKGKAMAEPTKGPAKKWKIPLPCESDEQRQVPRSENKCFICEQPCHIAENCPQKKRPADFEDKEDRKGKRPMAGLVPFIVPKLLGLSCGATSFPSYPRFVPVPFEIPPS